MANTKITALVDLPTPIGTDIINVVDDPGGTPISKKSTLANVLAVQHDHAASDITSGQLILEQGGTEADLSATGPGALVQASSGAAVTVETTLAHERGGLEADVSAYAGVPLITGGATSEIKYNMAAAVAPDADDDTGDGYTVGSLWFDTTADKAYVCLDATATAAVWELVASGAFDSIKRDNSGDYTTTSTSFVDIDATNLAITLTTSGRPVLVTFSARVYNTAEVSTYIDVDVDGVRNGGSKGTITGLVFSQRNTTKSLAVLIEGLTAASHDFTLQWRVPSGTGHLVAEADELTFFSVVEQL